MLYGDIELQREVIREVEQYAKREGIKPIFGAMVGSISQGVQYPDSDYDTRFLYLREDFPQKICIPAQMKEEELVKRYYPKDRVYEWIPFWEATSFFQFLTMPSFLNDFSVGLYNIVGWTMLSPYIWDPYGLQSRLMPLIHKIFHPEYEIAYHKRELEHYCGEWGAESVIVKSYLYSAHAAATIEWSLKYREQPPVDLQTLLCGLQRHEVWKEAESILEDARKEAEKRYREQTVDLHQSHFSIMTPCNEVIERYIREMLDRCQREDPVKSDHSRDEEILGRIYDIIRRAVFTDVKLLF